MTGQYNKKDSKLEENLDNSEEYPTSLEENEKTKNIPNIKGATLYFNNFALSNGIFTYEGRDEYQSLRRGWKSGYHSPPD